MRIGEKLKNNEGFTLVEVILAVVILALVSLPLINYFTYSSVRVVEGGDANSATVLAENAMDELKSYSNYNQIQELIPLGSSTASPAPMGGSQWTRTAADPRSTRHPEFNEMSKRESMGGKDYIIKARLDYDSYDQNIKTVKDDEKIGSGTGDDTDPQFNDFEIPQPDDVYSPNNIVSSEDDEADVGVSNLMADYANSDSGVVKSASDLATKLNRRIFIHLELGEDSLGNDTFQVKTGFEFNYNNEDIVEKVTMTDTEIRKDRLKCIYIFYKLLRLSILEEPVKITLGPGINNHDIENVKVIFVAQEPKKSDGTSKFEIPTGYHLKWSPESDALAEQFRFYSNNVNGTEVVLDGFTKPKKEDGTIELGLVSRKQSDIARIGLISIDVYDSTDTSMTKSLAHMESTMSE